jgi:flagellar biosynthetic protein FliR
MHIHIGSEWLELVILLSIRLGMVLVMTPLLGSTNLPVHLRVLLVLAFSGAMVSLLNLHTQISIQSPFNFLFAAMNELIWGGLLAFGLLAAFAAFSIGGRILDMQIGFGFANLFDPTTRTNSPLLSVVLNMYAVAWCLDIGVHHAVLRSLTQSLELAPLGSGLQNVPVEAMLYQFGLMFSLGLVLVGASIVCLLLTDIGMGIASRFLPQANVFILSTPIKIFAGLTTLSVATLYMSPVMKKIFAQVFNYWGIVLTK